MKLKKLDTVTKATEGAWVDINIPNGDSFRAKIIGIDSKEASEIFRKHQERLSKLENEDEETFRKARCEYLAEHIKSWELTDDEENPIEPNISNLIEIDKIAPYILNQIDGNISDRSNFIKKIDPKKLKTS